MRKVFLQEISALGYDAGSKARNDCDRILSEEGYVPLYFKYSRSLNFNRILRRIYPYIMALKLRKEDVCFLQYPYYTIKLSKFFFRIFFVLFHGHIECLIHDINSLRRKSGTLDPSFVYLIERCSRIIVHTPEMRNIIVQKIGVKPEKIKILYLFDYLTDSDVHPVDITGKRIIFAGNLSKSLFLKNLHKLNLQNIVFNLYGVFSENVVESKRCVYKGKFHPDNVSVIEGNWGLVWDGDSIDTCNGPLGEYLKINSSHKISLYLTACKPVIIWEESSLKDFILDNHLGIVVKSLYEIEEKLDALTEEEEALIVENVSKVSLKLRRGGFLKDCLKE